MNKKQIVRSGLFIVVLMAVMVQLCDLFEDKNSYMSKRYYTFQSFEEDTVDAVMLGTSGLDRYWIAAKAYEEYGMTVYPLSTDAQPAWLMLNMLKEAEVQTPELVIVDVRPFLVTHDPGNPIYKSRSRHIMDMLDFFSANRLDVIRRSLAAFAYLEPGVDQNVLSYYLPFIKYHMSWQDNNFTFTAFEDLESEYLGFYMKKSVSLRKNKKLHLTEMTEERVGLTTLTEGALEEFLDYCEGKDYELLFVSTPNQLTAEEAGRLNTVWDMLDERGVRYLDLTVADLELYDLTTDFYNHGHVNYYGAEKFTAYFSAYLAEHYELPDRRNEEAVAKDWSGVYSLIKEQIALWENK